MRLWFPSVFRQCVLPGQLSFVPFVSFVVKPFAFPPKNQSSTFHPNPKIPFPIWDHPPNFLHLFLDPTLHHPAS